MRIGLLGPAPFCGTGYGVQIAHLARILAHQGHDVAFFSFAGLEAAPLAWNGLPVYPKLNDRMGQDMAMHAAHFGADLVIGVMDLWTMQLENWDGVRLVPWFPVDHEPLSPGLSARIPQVFHPIVYSQHGQRVCAAAGFDVAQIPCMVDAQVFTPRARDEARSAAGLPQDRYIVGMVAANEGIPGRKAFWPQLRAFAYFHRQHPDTLLYLHTFANAGGERRAEPLLGMLDRLGLRVGEDVILADQYRYLLGYAPAELAMLYTSMDVLMAGAHGEGFCVPLIEAQACGTPVVCGDWTSMPELCFAGWKIPRLRAEVYNQTITDDDMWGQLGGDKVMPRTSAIVLALEAAYTRGSPPAFREQARAGALAFDVRAVAETHWRPMLARLEARIHGNV